MRNENYCIITGVLVGKSRNADTRDMKRPVIEIEIVHADEFGNVCFEKIPVLFSNVILSKALPGYSVGEILSISGELRSDKNGLYIEASTVNRVVSQSEKLKSVAVSRAELLQMQQRFNLATVVGTVKDKESITIPRLSLSRGDLKDVDEIPICYAPKNLPIGKRVACMGCFGSKTEYGELGLHIDEFYELVQEK